MKFISERIENILGKGENAGYQHFLLFPKCFQKPSLGSLEFSTVLLGNEPSENIVGKEENAGNQHFLLFQQCFLLYQ